jgi:O-antigen/teichoic acid export membrane protein
MLFNSGVFGVAVSLALVNLSFLIIQIYYILPLIKYDEHVHPQKHDDSLMESIPGCISFVKKLYLTSVTSIPQKELDITMLSIFTKPESVGIYRMAKNFVVALWALVDGVVLVIFPEIARLVVNKEYSKVGKIVLRTSLGGVVVSVVILASVALILPWILDLILGKEYEGSYELVILMFAGAIIWAPLIWVYPLALSIGKPGVVLLVTVVTGIFTSIAYYICIPWLGVWGASLVYAIAPGVMSILYLVGIWRNNTFKNIRISLMVSAQ